MEYLNDKTPEQIEVFEFVKAQMKEQMPEWQDEWISDHAATKLQWI